MDQLKREDMDEVKGEDKIDRPEGSVFEHTALHIVAYRVARYGPEVEKEYLADANDRDFDMIYVKDCNFVNAEDPNHAYYCRKVTEFKTSLKTQIPGLRWNTIQLPLETVVVGDMTANEVARTGPELEELLLADLKDRIHYYKFLKPDTPFHAYYQHRLTEYRAQVQAGNLSKLYVNTDGSRISSVAPAAAATPIASRATRSSAFSSTRGTKANRYSISD